MSEALSIDICVRCLRQPCVDSKTCDGAHPSKRCHGSCEDEMPLLLAAQYREIDRLRDLIMHHGIAPAWQPIETAPKDGTRVLACAPGDEPVIVSWSPLWFADWYDDHDRQESEVSVWQPLPALPEAKS